MGWIETPKLSYNLCSFQILNFGLKSKRLFGTLVKLGSVVVVLCALLWWSQTFWCSGSWSKLKLATFRSEPKHHYIPLRSYHRCGACHLVGLVIAGVNVVGNIRSNLKVIRLLFEMIARIPFKCLVLHLCDSPFVGFEGFKWTRHAELWPRWGLFWGYPLAWLVRIQYMISWLGLGLWGMYARNPFVLCLL